MRIGSLFSGYLGLDRAVEALTGATTAWVSDIDKGACKILAHRAPNVPNLGDITVIDWANVEPVDILTGGFPCQDLSHAGKRAGLKEGTRSGLWSHMARAIDELRPRLVVAENVRGLLSADAPGDVEPCPWCVGEAPTVNLRALGVVLADLADLGYDAQWCGLRAADVGACHGRFRIFLVAYPQDADSTTGGERWLPTSRQEAGWWARSDVGRSDREGTDGVSLLPTPKATNNENRQSLDRYGNTLPLNAEVMLMPTPSAADALGGHERRGGSRGDELLLNGMAKAGHLAAFGDYAPAIARWESVIERPAPDPTEPTGKGGAHRLSPRFVEWMMGLPDGWVTDVPDVTRNEALKALGNGVLPLQAETALRHMLTMAVAA